MERFNAKKPLYPILGLIVAIATLIFGLLMSAHQELYYFYIALFVLYICMGYYRAFIMVIPMAAVLGGLFALLTYLATSDIDSTLQAINRALAVCFMAVPGISISTTLLIRGLNQAKVPKSITLGMMISLNFFSLLSLEMKQIREAMKTRGVCSILNPKVLYRAFLLPLVVRIINISDTLSVSVETRGFNTHNKISTIYNPVKFGVKDLIFTVCFIGLVAGTGVFL